MRREFLGEVVREPFERHLEQVEEELPVIAEVSCSTISTTSPDFCFDHERRGVAARLTCGHTQPPTIARPSSTSSFQNGFHS